MLFAVQVGSCTKGATAGTCRPKVKSIVNIKVYVPLPHVMFGAAVPGRYDSPLFEFITAQEDATYFSLLHFCRQLYVLRVLTPIIRSSYNCNYSFWY